MEPTPEPERTIIDFPGPDGRQIERFDHEIIKSWFIDGHGVDLLESTIIYDDDSAETGAQYLECLDCPEKGAMAYCAGIEAVKDIHATEARQRHGQQWQNMDMHDALLDIVERVSINGEWMGQLHQHLLYAQDVQKLLDIDHPMDVMQYAYALREQGLVAVDGFTIFPGQQMLLKHRARLNLRWFV